ncbi:argininosuccinate synthase [Thermoplasma volcanium GSS1]|nr:argininosuccinate synthase [Thermoplasma volcanium GSS1]
MKELLLLYSGGLDTSVMIKWMNENLGYDVSTLTLDIGNNDLKSIREKAEAIGAVETFVEDV